MPKIKKSRKSQNVSSFKEEIDTMQDDVAGLISRKNNKVVTFKQNKNLEDLEVQRNLAEVYTDNNGEIPDLSKLDRAHRPKWKTVLYVMIAIMSVLLVAAIAGFFIFTNLVDEGFTNEKIKLNIMAPVTVVSGEETEYKILIENKENVSLYNVELELIYPEDFDLVNSEPVASGDKSNVWKFSVLNPGEKREIKLIGKSLAPLNSILTFKGILDFKPANHNAYYKQESITDIKVTASVISLDVEGPESVLADQKAEYQITYINTSQDDFNDLQLKIDYPRGFVFESASLESLEGKNDTWDISELKAGAEGKITVKGNYKAVGETGNIDFTVRLLVKKGSDFYPQAEETVVTKIIKDQLSLGLIINGSSGNQSVGFGDNLVYTLSYKNNGQETLENIVISAILDSQILDWDDLKNNQSGKIENGKIIWSGTEVSQLLKLGPGEEGELNWILPIRDSGVIDNNNISSFRVESYVEAVFDQPDGLGSGRITASSGKIVNSINSDLNLESRVRYYNEDNLALGIGPIEPKVGVTSGYNILLSLSNNLNNVDNLKVTAKLPDNVEWVNKETHDVGSLSYSSADNSVTWIINQLDKSSQSTEASFTVNITPTQNDAGRILILVSKVNLTAKDSSTGSEISKESKALTTSFDDPIIGQTSGIVQN